MRPGWIETLFDMPLYKNKLFHPGIQRLEILKHPELYPPQTVFISGWGKELVCGCVVIFLFYGFAIPA
jgi:hypothetical protein